MLKTVKHLRNIIMGKSNKFQRKNRHQYKAPQRGAHGSNYNDWGYDYGYGTNYGLGSAHSTKWIDSKDTKTPQVAELKPTAQSEVQTFRVVHSLKAWAQVQLLVNHFSSEGNEVSWFTPVIVNEDARTLTIPEIFIPEQEVSAAETDAPDLDIILPEVLAAGYGLDTIRGWFHLHPNGLSVTPSQQDEMQVEEYLDAGYPTLLRGIINDGGDFKLDYYDIKANLMHNNMTNAIAWGEAADDTGKILQIADERVSEATYNTVVSTTGRATTNAGYVSETGASTLPSTAKAYTGLIAIGPESDDGTRLGVYGSSLSTIGEDTLVYSTKPEPRHGQEPVFRIVVTAKTIKDFCKEGSKAIDYEMIADACEKAGLMIEDVFDLLPTVFGVIPVEDEDDDSYNAAGSSVTVG